jgi:hypothetical protein
MAQALAQQIVDEANVLHKAAVSKATYTVHCVYPEYDRAAALKSHENMRGSTPLCLTPLGSHLYIEWLGMTFRVNISDVATYGEIIDLVISSWRRSMFEPYGIIDQFSDHGEAVVGRIHMTHLDEEVNCHVDFDVHDSKETAEAIKQYLAPLRHLAPPLQV